MMKSKAPIIAGPLFIITGLALNVWTMTGLFSPYAYDSGSIASPIFKLAVGAFDVIMVIIGVLFILYRKKSFIIRISKNLILLHVTISMILVIFELLFPLFLPSLPMNLQSFINSPYEIICQNSKQELVPKKYIAIFGDSYAHGYGDWLLNTNFWKTEQFQTAHILNRELATDVIFFGSSGASSITGMVAKPINNFRQIRHRFDLPDPSLTLIYFYEGNDLTDNLRDLQFRQPNYFDFAGIDSLDKDIFMKFLDEKVVVPSNYEFSRSKVIGISMLVNLAYNAVNKLEGNISRGTISLEDWVTVPEYNLVRVDDSTFNLPQKLQGPACELTEDLIIQSINLFGYSLEFLKAKIPHSDIIVVYLPSVLSCYNVEGLISVITKGDNALIIDSETVYKNSNHIFATIDSICSSQKVAFIDTRRPLREAAKANLIHGPRDWRHFNRLGYEILGETIIEYIQNGQYLDRLKTR